MKDNQKGVSLFLVISMLAVLLAAVLGLTSVIMGGAKLMGSLSSSVKAFHAADTGMEKALWCIKTNAGNCDDATACANANNNFGSTGYGWTVTMTPGGSLCSDQGTKINSSGEFYPAKRKIETTY